MSIQSAFIGMIRQAVAAAGATMPKSVEKALADADRLATVAAALTPDRNEDLADAIADAILDDRDPLTDEQVKRHMARHALGESVGYIVSQAGERRVVAAVAASVDAILTGLAKGANDAGQDLAEAHAILGDLDLDDSQTIMQMGLSAAEAWTKARAAQQRLRTIDAGWVALSNVTGTLPASTHIPALRLANLTADQVDTLGRTADAWSIVRAGGRIELADRNTISQRVQRLADDRQQREDVAAGSFSREYRRLNGGGQQTPAA